MVEAGYTSSRGDVEEVTKFFHEGLGERSGVDVPSLAEVDGAKVLGCLGVQMPVATTADAGAGGGGGKKTNFTALLMTLIRLPSKETDILLTIAVPHVVGEYDAGSVALESEKRGPLIEEGMEIRREALKGFEIRDWGLFDG